MKVLVTGGTGFVGRAVLRQLQENGHSIRLLVRNPKSRRTRSVASKFGAELHAGSILDSDTLDSGVQGVDALIHLVGIISELGENTYEAVHARGTRNVITAAEQSGIRRYLHMSALGTRANAVSRYHQSKWTGEEAVRQSGLDWTIFRPSIIYGPGDGFVNLFAKMSRCSPVLPMIGGGLSRFQPVSVEVVAAAFVRALCDPGSGSNTFDLCGPEVLTLEEIIDTVLAVTRRRRLKVGIPLGLAKVQAMVLEHLYPTLLRKAAPLNRDQLLMMKEDNVGNPAHANALFNLKHTTFREGIHSYLAPKEPTPARR